MTTKISLGIAALFALSLGACTNVDAAGDDESGAGDFSDSSAASTAQGASINDDGTTAYFEPQLLGRPIASFDEKDTWRSMCDGVCKALMADSKAFHVPGSVLHKEQADIQNVAIDINGHFGGYVWDKTYPISEISCSNGIYRTISNPQSEPVKDLAPAGKTWSKFTDPTIFVGGGRSPIAAVIRGDWVTILDGFCKLNGYARHVAGSHSYSPLPRDKSSAQTLPVIDAAGHFAGYVLHSASAATDPLDATMKEIICESDHPAAAPAPHATLAGL